MSFKLVISFVLLVLLAVYFAFLNPGQLQVHLTRSYSLEMPLVVFLLSSMLVGVLLTALFQSFLELQTSWREFWENLKIKKQEARFRKWDKLFRKAENALASGRAAKGAALFEKILADHPCHAGALFHLGNHLRQEGQIDRAIELHLAALTADPEDIKVLHSLAEDYAQAGTAEPQIQTLNRCLELDPHSLPTLRKLRDAHMNTGNLEQAYTVQKSILPLIHDAEALRAEQDLFARIIYSVGLDHFQNGRLDKAIAEFKRSIRENDRSLPAYVTLGDLYLQAGNPRQALKIWKTGYEMTRAPVCLLRLQQVYEEQKKPGEINKLFREALAKSENSEKEKLALLYAHRLLKQGDREQAVAVLEGVKEASLLARLYALKAYQETRAPEQADATLQAAFGQITDAVLHFVCKNCSKRLETWSAFCPACQAWNSVHSGPAAARI